MEMQVIIIESSSATILCLLKNESLHQVDKEG